jgi:membrane protein YqaA with SNARE-associated domain
MTRMRQLLTALFGSLLSWWGLMFIAALDSSMIFFLPLGIDAAVVIMTSRSRELFWLYPILASAGSVCGAAVTYYIGRQLGEAGLKHFVSKTTLERVGRRVENKGAIALAVLDLIPPPFPFTACILVAGGLNVSSPLFFITLGVTRLFRFGGEAVLAYFYGRQIIRWLRSDIVEYVGITLFAIAIIGSVITAIQLVRKNRARKRSRRRAA